MAGQKATNAHQKSRYSSYAASKTREKNKAHRVVNSFKKVSKVKQPEHIKWTLASMEKGRRGDAIALVRYVKQHCTEQGLPV
jgi:hypothetical protein